MSVPRRLRRAGLLALAGSLLLVPSADASWLITGSLTTQATAVSLNRPTAPTVANGTGADVGSVRVSWAASTLSNGDAVDGYRVERVVGGTTTTACTTTTALTCLDTSPVDGTAAYRVVSTKGTAWVSLASASASFTRDGVAPTTVASLSPAANGDGWHRAGVSVTLTATDNAGGSGVDRIVYSINGGTAVTVSAATTTFALAQASPSIVYTVTYRAYDVTGNAEAIKTSTVRIDPTNPAATASLSPAANADGWNNTNVTLTVSATDVGGSGVKQVVVDGTTTAGSSGAVTLTAEGTRTISYSATDVAGNSAAGTQTVRIDKTLPTVGGLLNGVNSNCNGNNNDFFCANAGDALSGVRTVTFTVTNPAGQCLTAANTFIAPPQGGCAQIPMSQVATVNATTNRYRSAAFPRTGWSTGQYAYVVTATDLAGNIVNSSTTFSN